MTPPAVVTWWEPGVLPACGKGGLPHGAGGGGDPSVQLTARQASPPSS